MRINRLSVAAVNAKRKSGLYADGGGLYLQVAKGGSKTWIFRYMLAGRPRKMGLGSIHTVSLKLARERAAEQRLKLLDADDPIELRKAERMAKLATSTTALSFREAAEQYINTHRAGWKNVKHAGQWEATLKTYVYPVFGDLAVSRVDVALVMKVLEPIWSVKPETASRVRGRIESILDWAKARHLREGENPARWKGHLDKLLPARNKVAKVEHHAALPYAEIGAFIDDLGELDGNGARALEFAILTAARTGEVVGANWQEVDFDSGMWTIPAERMKASREHRVPLSSRAVEILKALPREEGNPHVFIGAGRSRPLSNMAMLMTLRRMERADLTVHGFRSTFRDWAAEQTAYPNEMLEMALAHTVGDKTEAAYRRGDMVEKRRRLMDDWAVFCDKGKSTADNVTPIRKPVTVERLADLKMGLTNSRKDLRLNRQEKLVLSLEAAAETFDSNNAKSAAMALDAVMAFLHDERLEAPFRFLVDGLDESRRKGATKRLDQALDEARLAATVDAVMAEGDAGQGCTLEDACKAVSEQAAWTGTIKNLRGNRKGGRALPDWKIIKSLRDNIRHGKARSEATEVYRYHLYHLLRDWSPNEELPAPLAGSKKGNRKRDHRP
ncbi:integrase arm-type DNA-binding domain-containing protein [Mesorhizobium sp. KR9-304]|uniref:tyrosine-type recombinase/integrase n=1 Tax=Mesorhizobium sp. KR9-304 TaxID=3156614 RepID=UPI0032B45473